MPSRRAGTVRGPLATVVVCAYNREAQIGRCLERLAAQTLRDLEIVVGDDGSIDGTAARVEAFAASHPGLPVRLVRNERNLGVSAARNAGIAAARGERVFFPDSDCTAEAGWLAALGRAFEDPAIAAAAGTVIDAQPRTMAERAYAGTCRVGRGGLQRRALVGNNMGFRAEVLWRHRFDPALTYGSDEDELAWRLAAAGHRIVFVPEAVIRHHHRLDLGGFLRMAHLQGAGSARFWYKKGTYVGRDLLLLYGAVFALPLVFFGGWTAWTPAGLLVLHLAALAYAEVVFKGKRILEAAAAVPLLFLHSLVKGWSAAATLLRIALGREPQIRRSKRIWRVRRAGEDRTS